MNRADILHRVGWILRGATGGLLLLGTLAGCAGALMPAPTVTPAEIVQTSPGGGSEELPIKGSAEAPVTLVIFCDFV